MPVRMSSKTRTSLITTEEMERKGADLAMNFLLVEKIFPWLLKEKCHFSVIFFNNKEVRLKMNPTFLLYIVEKIIILRAIVLRGKTKQLGFILKESQGLELLVDVSGHSLVSGQEAVLFLSVEKVSSVNANADTH